MEKITLDLNNPIMIIYYPLVDNQQEQIMVINNLKKYFNISNITFWYLMNSDIHNIKIECIYQGSYVNKGLVDIFDNNVDKIKELLRDYKIEEVIK